MRDLQSRERQFPFATAMVLASTVAITGARFLVPGLAEALRRDLPALEAGEWWRAVTPLFMQTDPWPATLSVWALLWWIGVLVERLFGTTRWLILYGAGAVAGEAVGYVWQPHGSGGSVAIAGLLGGLMAWCLLEPTPWFAKAGSVIVIGAALADTWINDIHGLPLLAGLCVGAFLIWKGRTVK